MTEEKKNKEKEEGINIDFGLGGLFKGLGSLIDTATKLAEKGEELSKTSERSSLAALIKSRGLRI